MRQNTKIKFRWIFFTFRVQRKKNVVKAFLFVKIKKTHIFYVFLCCRNKTIVQIHKLFRLIQIIGDWMKRNRPAFFAYLAEDFFDQITLFLLKKKNL